MMPGQFIIELIVQPVVELVILLAGYLTACFMVPVFCVCE
jgi:hypothetical protein